MKILLIFPKQIIHSEEAMFLNETIQSFVRSGYQVEIHEASKEVGLRNFIARIRSEVFDSIHFIYFKQHFFLYRLVLKLLRFSYTGSFSSKLEHTLPISIEFSPPEKQMDYASDFIFPIYASKMILDKNQGVEEFCNLDLKGTKIIFGQGPLKAEYEKEYGSRVLFYPMDQFRKMSHWINVFVYTKKTTTVPMYAIEALSYSIPVASVNNASVKKIIKKRINGFMAKDLELSALECLSLSRGDCFQSVKPYFMNERFKELARSCLAGSFQKG